jgi:hypothetical protein
MWMEVIGAALVLVLGLAWTFFPCIDRSGA